MTPTHAHPHPAQPHVDPQRLADAVRVGMFATDAAAQALGMVVEAVGPGTARVVMTVREDMLNGFRICHGGMITTLADTAFAYACNSHNELTVAGGIVVDFMAPAHLGDRLVAEAHEVSRSGRTGVYDVTVRNPSGKAVALLRGRSATMRGKHVVPPPEAP